MTCKNYWANYGYWKVWEDADYFYAIDKPGGGTNKILKSAVCENQANIGTAIGPQPLLAQGNWILFLGLGFVAVLILAGGRK